MNVVHTNLILAVGTPLTFVGGNLIAHEHVRANQWFGMILALAAGTYISIETVRSHCKLAPPSG
jgi:drug/metabolite transporter (DMT)-like permease